MAERQNVFLFSGQGSQYYQMGKSLFQIPVFKQTMHDLDQVAESLLGESVIAHIYNSKYSFKDTFDQIHLSHPAIFMVEIATAYTLISMGIKPDSVLGYSLGMFAAATLAGSLTAEEALRAVIEQARCIEQYCPEGGMVAIVEDTQLFQDAHYQLSKYSELAAINFDTHFVISASNHDLNRLEPALKEFTSQKLPVTYAFHSHWIEGAKEPYLEYLKSIYFKVPQLPMWCCKSGSIETRYSAEKLWSLVREPILFKKTISNLESRGRYNYIDCGPSSTLVTFLKYLLSNNLISHSTSKCFPIITPYATEIKNIERIKENSAH